MAESKVGGYSVDPAKQKLSGKTVDAVAVYDSVGYTDSEGFARYVDRGTEITLPEEEWERLHDRTEKELAEGNYPAVVEPDHPHLAHLVKPVPASENPNLAGMRLAVAHGAAPPLLDPAGDPANVPASGPGAPSAPAGLSIDWSKLSKANLEAVAEQAGIDTKGMNKDEIAAELSAAAAGSSTSADVTPRVGSSYPGDSAETGSDSAES